MRILTENELANELGLSAWTVRRMRLQEGCPHFRVGNRVFYEWEAVCRWIETKQQAGPKPEAEAEYGRLRRIR